MGLDQKQVWGLDGVKLDLPTIGMKSDPVTVDRGI
jgi:hypothetical protein